MKTETSDNRHDRTVIVTGATGFVGHNLLRIPDSIGLSRAEIPNWSPQTDFTPFLMGSRALIHAAGPAHGKARNSSDLFLFHVEVTRKLIEDAYRAGIRHFILISSASVYGTRKGGEPFSELETPRPGSPYAKAKCEAENVVKEFCASHPSMDYTIFRPPMIYGPQAPGTPAKIRRLLRWLIPLPFGGLMAKRSALDVELLLNTVSLALDHGAKSNSKGLFLNQIVNVADSPTLPVGNLIRKLAPHHRRWLILRIHETWMRFLLWPLRCFRPTRELYSQLFDSFVLDTSVLDSWTKRTQRD